MNKLNDLLSFLNAYKLYHRLSKEGLLRNGKYKIHLSGKPVIYNWTLVQVTHDYESNNISWYDKYVFENINEDEKAAFHGDIVMILANGGYKIFDLKNYLIFTRADKNKAHFIFESNLIFKKFYNTTFYKLCNGGYIDTYIPHKKENDITENNKKEIIKEIINRHIDFISHSNIVSYIMTDDLNNKLTSIRVNSLRKLCKKLISCVEPDLKVPLCIQHGDLHFGNILITDEKWFLIDFEACRIDLFYYDIFNLLYVELVDHNNSGLLREYFRDDSDIDSLVRTLFESINSSYDATKKKEYFALYLLTRIFADVERTEKNKNPISAWKYMGYLVKKNMKVFRFMEEQV